MGPSVPQDSHVSGWIKNERTVCKDSELIHPKDMRRDPSFFIWNFSGTWDYFATGSQNLHPAHPLGNFTGPSHGTLPG